MSVAIALALRATLGMLSGVFGVYEIITAIRYWYGRPGHLALSAVIEKEFGIIGDSQVVPTNRTQPSLTHAELRFRVSIAVVTGLSAGGHRLWNADSLPMWQSLLLLGIVLLAVGYYFGVRHLMSFYTRSTPNSRLQPTAPEAGSNWRRGG